MVDIAIGVLLYALAVVLIVAFFMGASRRR